MNDREISVGVKFASPIVNNNFKGNSYIQSNQQGFPKNSLLSLLYWVKIEKETTIRDEYVKISNLTV